MQDNIKPSDRLKELFQIDKEKNPQNTPADNSINAIIMYLDEEYEKKQPQQDKLLD